MLVTNAPAHVVALAGAASVTRLDRVMARYDQALSLEAARAQYFADNDFSAGYDERWVKVRVGRRKLALFPNTQARVAAVRLHDLHHLATEYDTTWVGEGEIGAWELGSGCGPYLAAWVLDLSILFIGCVLSPRRMLRAFVRGRHSKNLYALGWNPARLSASVGELRRELGVDQAPPAPSVADLFAFAGWVALSTLYSLGGSLSLVTFAFAMLKMPQAQLAGGPPANSPSSPAPAQ
jgi:hypothetical protein